MQTYTLSPRRIDLYPIRASRILQQYAYPSSIYSCVHIYTSFLVHGMLRSLTVSPRMKWKSNSVVSPTGSSSCRIQPVEVETEHLQ
jgi:hypothetical protein